MDEVTRGARALKDGELFHCSSKTSWTTRSSSWTPTDGSGVGARAREDCSGTGGRDQGPALGRFFTPEDIQNDVPVRKCGGTRDGPGVDEDPLARPQGWFPFLGPVAP